MKQTSFETLKCDYQVSRSETFSNLFELQDLQKHSSENNRQQ